MEILFIVILFSVFLILIISISWTNYKGSPWVPTTFKMVHKMLDLADIQPNELVYELGCGDGRIAVIAARKYQARVVGIELNPFLWLWCQLVITIFGLRSRVKVVLGNFYKRCPKQTKNLKVSCCENCAQEPGSSLTLSSSTRFVCPNVMEKLCYISSPRNTRKSNL